MPESARYYRQREASARACAARATDPLAIRLHLELADEYAKIVESGENVRLLIEARHPTYIIPEDDSGAR